MKFKVNRKEVMVCPVLREENKGDKMKTDKMSKINVLVIVILTVCGINQVADWIRELILWWIK